MSDKKISTKVKLKAVIIGAGRIASGFDNPKDSVILTHAHAFIKHPQIKLVGFFDVDKKAAVEAAKKWNCQSFLNFDEMFKVVKPDIVSICTPDHDHFSSFKKTAVYKPTMIVCEKPATDSAARTEELARLCQKEEISVIVNFSRRFDPVVQDLKKEIYNGIYGKVICASGIYTKGIKHNGSHMIDLARFLFGEVESATSLHTVSDYTKDDKTVAGFLQFELCPQFYLLAGNENKFSIFELDILFEKGRVKFVDSGYKMEKFIVQEDKMYPGFFGLSRMETKKTKLNMSMLAMADETVKNILFNHCVSSSLENALETQKVCEKLLRH